MLAYRLAKLGFTVGILEKQSLPRYKPCGGGLTFKAIRCIPFDIKPAIELEASGGIVLYGGKTLLKTKVDQPFAWLVDRAAFDHFLAQKSAKAGVTLLESTEFTGFDQLNGTITVHTTRGNFSTRILVGADGINSRVARAAGLLEHRKTGFAIEAELAVSPDRLAAFGSYAAFDFSAYSRGYAWIFPKKDHVSVGIFQAKVGKAEGIRKALDLFISRNSFLVEARISHIQGHQIPLGGNRTPLSRGPVLLVGDAANLADPWLGEGLYYSLRSSEIAAGVICDGLKTGAVDLQPYTHQVNREIVSQLAQARLLANLVYLFPYPCSHLISQSVKMQKIVFGAIRGDFTFRQLNYQLILKLPSIIKQALFSRENRSYEC
jgi:geranylgeranyl reductase family protein